MIKRLILLAILGLLLFGCGKKPQTKLIGSWVVDYGATFMTVRNSEIWNDLGEAEKEMFPDLLEEMIAGMRITIDDSELKTRIGNEQVIVPYEIVSVTGNEITTKATISDDIVELIFNMISDNQMMFTSSATDDMDYMVWKRDAVQKI